MPFRLDHLVQGTDLMSSSLAHSLVAQANAEPTAVSARFLVQGLADPGLLPRLIEPFSKLGLVPSRVHASCEAGDGSQMTVDLRLCGAKPRLAELVEYELRRIVGVSQLIAVVEPA
jgi:hypothetical protein